MASQLTDDELKAHLDLALKAADAAGEVLKAFWGKLTHVTQKGFFWDLVTEADKAAEDTVIAFLKQHTPDYTILAEESGLQKNSLGQQVVWVIDPLDGTTNYTHQFPIVATAIGLLVDGEPQVGVIYNPLQNELFAAAKGLGATFNGTAMHVSNSDALATSLLATGFAYDRLDNSDNNYAEFCKLTDLCQGVRRLGSACLDLAYVACGRFDGFWERGLKPWDMVSGALMVREAGGTVSSYDGTAWDSATGRIVATNGKIHTLLCHELQGSSASG